MSTRCTIASGDGFHMFSDTADDFPHPLYVSVSAKSLGVEDGIATVAIPLSSVLALTTALGKMARSIQRSAQETDDEIEARVRSDVAQRIGKKGLSGLIGYGVYGSAMDEESAQVARGVAHYHEQRKQSREVVESWK